MMKMQEDDFEKIEATTEFGKCEHEIVKLYFGGMHSDYGCIKCKVQSLDLSEFNKKSNTKC